MLPDVGRVKELGHERGLADPRKLRQMPEQVFAVEFHTVGLLVLPGRGVTAQFHEDIVVEFTVVKDRHAPPVLRIRAGLRGLRGYAGCLEHTGRRKDVKDGQLAGDVVRIDHGAEVFGGVRGIREERITRLIAANVRGADEPPDHLAVG